MILEAACVSGLFFVLFHRTMKTSEARKLKRRGLDKLYEDL